MPLILPGKYEIPEEYDFKKVIAELFSVFSNDFIKNETYFLSRKIVFDNRITEESEYPNGFWHLVTRIDYSVEEHPRLFDKKRSERIPWIKKIIEQYKDPQIKTWHACEPDRSGGRFIETYYFWYEVGNFLVILKEKRNNYFLATSYYVDNYNKVKYERKYQAGLPV